MATWAHRLRPRPSDAADWESGSRAHVKSKLQLESGESSWSELGLGGAGAAALCQVASSLIEPRRVQGAGAGRLPDLIEARGGPARPRPAQEAE